ncbi:MAG: rare lipoprotein [Acidobacteriota bacterium]|nr:rare lipoprotein [Acidobacteriota bacterium]
MRRAKTAFATIFAACLAAAYLMAAVRLDQASAAVVVPSQSIPAVAASLGSPMVGEAAYYGAELAGHPTASGEIFDPSLLTAAHRTLPLGSQVQVTNLGNGLSTVVRINDRGPYSGDSIIDLSTAAAQRIGLRGSDRVQLERLR